MEFEDLNFYYLFVLLFFRNYEKIFSIYLDQMLFPLFLLMFQNHVVIQNLKI